MKILQKKELKPSKPDRFYGQKKQTKYTITNFVNIGLNHQFGEYNSFRVGYNDYFT